MSVELDEDLIDRLLDVSESLTVGAVDGGDTLAGQGAVTALAVTGDRIEAEVLEAKKSRTFHVTLALDDPDETFATCACRRKGNCEHVQATVQTLLYGALHYGGYTDVETYPDVADNFPPAWHKAKNLPPEALFASFGKAMAAAASVVPSTQAVPLDWWREYLGLATREERSNLMYQVARARLGVKRGDDWLLRDLAHRCASTDNPLDDLREFADAMRGAHRYLRTNVRQFEEPGLRPFLASPEAEEFARRYKAETDMREVCRWIETAPIAARRAGGPAEESDRLEAVWTLVRASDGLQEIAWQLLLTSRRLDRAARTRQGIDQLARDMEAGRRVLTREGRQLLTFVTVFTHFSYGERYGAYGEPDGSASRDETLFPIRATERWLILWAGQPLLQWRDSGAPVDVDWRGAELVPHPDANGQFAWMVRVPAADGGAPAEMLPLAEAPVAIEIPPDDAAPAAAFVRRGHMLLPLDTGGMPRPVLAAAVRQALLPVDRLRTSAKAAQRFVMRYGRPADSSGGAPALGGLVRTVPVRPVVELRLQGERTIEALAYAEAADGSRFCRDMDGLWAVAAASARQDAPASLEAMTDGLDEGTGPVRPAEAEAAPEAICTVPSPADVAPLEKFLAAFVPRSAASLHGPGGVRGFTWTLGPKALPGLARTWAERPTSILYLGNEAFRDLFVLRRPPRISVQVEGSGVDWFGVSVAMEKEIAALSPAEVREALATEGSRLVALPGGRVYKREDLEEYQRTWDAVSRLGLNPLGDEQRVHALQLVGGGEETLAGLGGGAAGLADRIRLTVEAFRGIPAAAVAPELAAVLRPYQRQGVDFLVWAWENFGGAILADDMGLGKTLQVLAALSVRVAAAEGPREPSLVVCPTSVTHGWQREAARFAPWLKAAILQRGPDRKHLLAHLGDYDLVITNYALARLDAAHLGKLRWRMACVDEAQAIKNPDADIAKTVKTFDAECRVALTGTPIENRLLDLWSIADFASPGYLGTHRAFDRRLKEDTAEALYQGLRARLRPVLMRRLKKEVATELPPRIEERRDCEMHPAQRKVYLAELKRTRDMLASAKSAAVSGPDRIQILAALTRLRQICCDPALVGADAKGSGKVDATLEIVAELVEAGHKVLLFSQFVRMLERLETALKKASIAYWVLTGQTTNRQEVVDAFERTEGAGVFLISLKAGGTGLNLTSAAHVILFDPWWNPAVEAQAIDRTHRIGQDKTVIAYRMVTSETIEERILELQEKKRSLVQNVLEEDAFNRMLTRDDLAFILDGQDTSSGASA